MIRTNPVNLRFNNLPPRSERGISMVELLVAAVIAFAAIGMAGSILLEHIKSMKIFESSARSTENLSRVVSLLNAEASEGFELSRDTSLGAGSGCSPAPVGDVLVILTRDGEGADQSISYYGSPGVGIYRCGPSLVDVDSAAGVPGSIDFASDASAALVGPQMSISFDSSTDHAVSYSVNFTGKDGATYSRSSAASIGGRYINSPTP